MVFSSLSFIPSSPKPSQHQLFRHPSLVLSLSLSPGFLGLIPSRQDSSAQSSLKYNVSPYTDHLRPGPYSPQAPHTCTHHSQDHLSSKPLKPMTRRSHKSTAAGLGKVNSSGRSPRPHAPSCSSEFLQMGSPRRPKGLLTRLLSRVPSSPQGGPLQGLGPHSLGSDSPPATWPTFSPGPLPTS